MRSDENTKNSLNTYLVLIRGINVGGKNKILMASLKARLEEMGFSNVTTYIASGNVMLRSNLSRNEVRVTMEKALPEYFNLDDAFIRVLVLTPDYLRSIINHRPVGFGEYPEKYHSDVIFLMGIESTRVMGIFKPREGVDKVWPGKGVVYSQRLSAERTKSRLNRIMSVPEYKLMTIRTWRTTQKLLELVEKLA